MIPLWVEHYLYKQCSFLTVLQCALCPPPFLWRAQKAGSYLKHSIKWKDRLNQGLQWFHCTRDVLLGGLQLKEKSGLGIIASLHSLPH